MTNPQPYSGPYPGPHPGPDPGPYPGLPYPYAAYGQDRRIHDLTVPAALAFAAAVATTAVGVVSAALVGHAAQTGTQSLDVLSGAWALASLLVPAGLLAGWLTGSFWLYRARSNADLLFPTAHHARSPGWAWGGWVCPVVSLWFPYQVVADVRRAPFRLDRRLPPLVGLWWTCWLLTVVGQRTLSYAADAAVTSPGEHPGLQSFAWVWAGLMVLTLCLWGLVLRRVTLDQRAAVSGGSVSASVGT